jgi:hypothetical protein
VGHILLPQVKLGLQTLIGACLVQRVEIFALQVLEQRQSQHFCITRAPDQGWDGLQTGHLRGSPPTLPGNQFEAMQLASHDDRLQETLSLQGTRQFLQPLRIKMLSRLIGIGVHL